MDTAEIERVTSVERDAAEIYRFTDIGGAKTAQNTIYKSEPINPNIFDEKSQLSLVFYFIG
jgi:dihydroxyacetone kinase DhaKLM complex PTS-EIIA-like component DhaM